MSADILSMPSHIARVTIKERIADKDRLNSDPMHFEARIDLPKGEYHAGHGRSPADALLQAALHWYKHE